MKREDTCREMTHATAVRFLKPYVLRVTFSDGVTKDVDLEAELWGEVFETLADVSLFRQARIGAESRTVEWPNGADLAPEFLYETGRTVEPIS